MLAIALLAFATKTETIRIPSPIPGLELALHHEFPVGHAGPVVLFSEGNLVPTAGNAGFKIDGLSWMDDLAQHGYDVWSFDYLATANPVAIRAPTAPRGAPRSARRSWRARPDISSSGSTLRNCS